MVTIKSSHMVIPANPTPSGLLWLSECDQVKPWTHAPLLFIYKPNNTISTPIAQLMRNSLSQLLVSYYPFAGRLRWIKGGRFEIDCNAMGAELLEAESEVTIDELDDFRPTSAVGQLMPKIDYDSSIEDLPLLVVQVTRLRCGGVTVGIAASHILVDGDAVIKFTNSWAKLTRGERVNPKLFFDRTVLRSQEPLMPPRYDHEEFKLLPLVKGYTDDTIERNKETIAAVLKLNKEQIERLQKMVANDNPNQNMARYSRYEVVASHAWRCACKARIGSGDQPTKFRVVVDARNRLKPPLPQDYFGNAVFVSMTSACIFDDLLSKPLGYAAGKIREAIEKMTDDYFRSALDFMTSQEDLSPLRTSFHTVGDKRGQFLGNPNLTMTSWIHMQICDPDFGWGKPIYVGPGLINQDGKFFVMQGCDGDGSLNIVFRLQAAHMNAFKKFFYEDIQQVFPPSKL